MGLRARAHVYRPKGGWGSGAYQPTSAVTPGTTTPPASRYRPTVLYAVLYGTLVLRFQTSLSLYHTVLLITCTVLYSNTSLQYSSRYRRILTTESDFRGNLRSIQYIPSLGPLCQLRTYRYAWRAGALHATEAPYNNGSAALRERLASRQRAAGVRMRLQAYDVCLEGAMFHAGLKPQGSRLEPACASGTWALLDDIGRFTGSLQVLEQDSCDDRRPRA